MSAPPFDSLVEAYLEGRFGIIEGSLTFASGEHWDYGYGGESSARTVFEITVRGARPDDPDQGGADFCEIFEDGDAVTFLDEMFAWRGDS